MVKFGSTEIFHPDIKNDRLAKLFLKVFGNVDTGSSHLHFIKTVKILPFVKITKILDAGCGKGKFSFWLAQKYPNIHIDACEICEENIALCQETQSHLNTKCNFFVQDLLPFKNPSNYDFIFSNHVLEHISENEKVIHNLLLSLKPRGYIYIQIPNATESRLFGERFVKFHSEWAKDEHVGQILTLSSLTSLLECSGCTILIGKHTSGSWGKLSFELKEMALHYFNSKLLFVVLYPLLKLFGYVDSLTNYKDGNGILVLAQKTR